MDELVVWLRAQFDKDERIARAATPGPWAWTPETDVWDQNGPTLIRESTDAPGAELVEVAAGWGHDAWGMHVSEADQAHIARHDPAWVLREIDAKRQLVEKAADADRYSRTAWANAGSVGAASAYRAVLRLLALPYADRPGYREEWRP